MVINLANKIVKIVLTDRLEHYAVLNGIIKGNEARFMRYRNCEQQVWTAVSSINAWSALRAGPLSSGGTSGSGAPTMTMPAGWDRVAAS